jgi:Calcineurin-like phosphoesterase
MTALASLALKSTAMTVTADPDRKAITTHEHILEHFLTSGSPVGHGYQQANLAHEIAYYAFDQGTRLRCVVLDTVNHFGGWQGCLDPEQLHWLETQLAAADDSGRQVVLFSHHPVETMVNDRCPEGTRRVLAAELTEVLLRHPSVALWLNGHTHEHRITAITDGLARGFWQVTTASHIDWPQQSRLVEIGEAADGTLLVACTVLDSAAPTAWSGGDWQSRQAPVGTGEAGDRNVVLVLPSRRTA